MAEEDRTVLCLLCVSVVFSELGFDSVDWKLKLILINFWFKMETSLYNTT